METEGMPSCLISGYMADILNPLAWALRLPIEPGELGDEPRLLWLNDEPTVGTQDVFGKLLDLLECDPAVVN